MLRGRTGRRDSTAIVAALFWMLASGSQADGQAASQPGVSPEKTGQELYRFACVACHGADGAGAARSTVGFDTPLPDFGDCSFATREPDADWLAIAHEGGPVRAFDRRMPAFGTVLSAPELQRILDHLRTFCGDRAWPRGELNLPRALVTEKAFPEDEAVLSTTMAKGGVSNEFLYERRLGARSQFEIVVPIELQERAAGWRRGLGDVAVAVKHTLFHSHQAGRIVSVAGEVVFPTGKETEGLGNGVTVFESFVAFGQVLPADGFIQIQAGVELPANRDRANNEVFWRAALGRSLVEGQFGRTWSPMVELLAAHEVGAGEATTWDIVPQMQVTLSQRQHVMISAGVRIPLNEREGRNTQVLTYLLWDWFDGGLFDGWR